MMETTHVPEQSENTMETATTLTKLDRCDAACSGAAMSVARWEWGGELMFCGHHTTKHREALEAQGALIITPSEKEADTRTPVTTGS